MIGLDLGVAGIDGHGDHLAVADRWNTNAYPTADTLLLAVVGELVFYAFDLQITANVGGDPIGTSCWAL